MTQIFDTGFGPYTFPGDTLTAERDGFTYTATIHSDTDHGAPWDECDGHGPVSDWTSRDKQPGELILCGSHPRAGQRRYYDLAEACRIARRDGWGFTPYRVDMERGANGLVRYVAQEFIGRELHSIVTDWHDCEHAAYAQMHDLHRALYTPRAYAAAAARSDCEVLRAWCDDKWSYCGIDVTVTDSDGQTVVDEYTCALWGIEMNYPNSGNAYLLDVANQLASEAYDSHVLPLLQARETVAALAGVGA